MRIGIVGAGMIGHALGVRFAAAGHEVMLSNSRGPDTLAGIVASVQGNVHAGTVAEAARFGEVVAVAIPLPAIRELPAEPFAGKIVVDAKTTTPSPRDGSSSSTPTGPPRRSCSPPASPAPPS
jgi:8-hydroxy-5-deazaflavin:NADPH oxidoreductase